MNTPRTTISFSKMSAAENNSVEELLELMPGQTYSIAGEEWSWSNINNTEDTWLNNWNKRNVFEEMRSVMTETSVFGRPLITIPDSFSFL